jgi:outer membrane lipoprotein carrier protein
MNKLQYSALSVGFALLTMYTKPTLAQTVLAIESAIVGTGMSTTAKSEKNLTNKQEASLVQSNESTVDKKSLRSLLGEFSSLRADFTQIIKDMQGQELQNSSGSILLQKPMQLRWSVDKPEESMLLADGKTVYNIDPWVEQVTLLDQSDLTKSNPLMLLISDDESQWSQVNVSKLKVEAQTRKKEIYTIISDDPNSSIVSLVLTFDKDKKLNSLESTDRQQQVNIVTFTDTQYNGATDSSKFSFNAPSTWSVDDQRAKTQ